MRAGCEEQRRGREGKGVYYSDRSVCLNARYACLLEFVTDVFVCEHHWFALLDSVHCDFPFTSSALHYIHAQWSNTR